MCKGSSLGCPGTERACPQCVLKIKPGNQAVGVSEAGLQAVGVAGAACTGGLTPVSVCVSSLDRYAVFGLGSSMYPQFCAFAHDVDQKLSHLGASQLTPTGEGDELSGQEEAFRSWAVQTFKVSSSLELLHSIHRVL